VSVAQQDKPRSIMNDECMFDVLLRGEWRMAGAGTDACVRDSKLKWDI
jgi:hypothetical protein